MMRVFLDSDVILDCVLGRNGYCEQATLIMNLCETGRVEGLTSSLAVANCHHVFSRQANAEKSRTLVARLRAILNVCAVGDRQLGEALVSDFADLEDGIQHFTAVNNQADVIVTRNTSDFKSSAIPVMNPHQFLASLPR